TDIGLSAGAEDFAPAIVDFTEDAGDHAAHLVGRRAGLGWRGSPIGLIGRRRAAAVENLRAADQKPRVDAERITDQAEHDDGADAETAAADRKAKAAATTHSAAAVVATVFDVVAATEIIVTHGAFPSFQFASLFRFASSLRKFASLPAVGRIQRDVNVKFLLR